MTEHQRDVELVHFRGPSSRPGPVQRERVKKIIEAMRAGLMLGTTTKEEQHGNE